MNTVTIKDIARKAGVSYQSVSKILNQQSHLFKKATREKVLKIARELNYRPHFFARSLKTTAPSFIGIVHGSLKYQDRFNQPYQADIYDGIREYFTHKDCSLLFYDWILQDSAGLSPSAVSNIINGLIISLYSQTVDYFMDYQATRLWQELNIPFMVIHSLNKKYKYSSIGLDCQQGGFLATEHLARHGYKSIGFVTVDRTSPHSQRLFEGYRKALKKHSIPFQEKNVFTITEFLTRRGYGPIDSYKYAGVLLDQSGQNLPRALLVSDDTLAYGMIDKFTEKGINIPDDLAIIGFGDWSSSQFYNQDLTSIRQLGKEKGQKAAEMLHSYMQNPKKFTRSQTVILTPELAVRKSCGCNK